MSLEHFVDGLMSEYTGFGEDPKYKSIEEPKLRNSEESVYNLGQSLGIVSKLTLGGLGIYSLYTVGAAAAMSVAGPLMAVACLKMIFVDPFFIRAGKKPLTLGGLVKKAVNEIKLYRKKQKVVDFYNEHGPISREEALEAAIRVAELDTEEGLGELRIEGYPE